MAAGTGRALRFQASSHPNSAPHNKALRGAFGKWLRMSRAPATIDIMIVAFSVAPAVSTEEDGGMADAVAEAIRVVRESGLPNETNAMCTLIEGEWDEVFAVVKKATEAISAVSPRTSLVLKADIRPGYTGQLKAKVDAVNERIGEPA